ncbi:MAG: hypothetical protein NTZ40_12080 [Cyanobacteria bacterium]|nr:hypothetical protein [Cyanobacteriota bacterium]
MGITLKKNEANMKHPLAAPEIAKKPEQVQRVRLSNYQIIGAIISVLALLILATSRWGQHAPLYVEDVQWKSLQRFCRVTFTAKNPRSQSIKAQVLIVFFKSIDAGYSNTYVPFGSVKVPLSLAGNGSQTVTKDIEHSETTSGCQRVEVNALGVIDGK